MHEGRSDGLERTDTPVNDQHSSFTSPDKIEVTHFAPAAELAPYVTQIYFFRCDEPAIRDRQPAALGHLIFLLSGRGTLKFQNGDIVEVADATVFGPGLAAAEFDFEGPLYDLGFALSPLGIRGTDRKGCKSICGPGRSGVRTVRSAGRPTGRRV
jgi:hypothetical protein